eukprot:gene31720-39183_t
MKKKTSPVAPATSSQTHDAVPASASTPGQRHERQPARMLALEQRLMFDGAALDTALGKATDKLLPPNEQTSSLHRLPEAGRALLAPALPDARSLHTEKSKALNPAAESEATLADATLAPSPARVPQDAHALIVLSADLSALKADLQAQYPQAQLRVLAADAEPLQALADVLAQETGITALHLISHGEPGALIFGDTRVDQAYLSTHAQTLAAWRSALAPDADVLLYGCDVAAQGTQSVFLQQLHTVLGADVAASSDATGSAALGADAQLEVVLGQVDSASVLSSDLLDKLGLMLDSTAPTVQSVSVAVSGKSLQLSLQLSEGVGTSTGLASTRLSLTVGGETLIATLDAAASNAAAGLLVYTASSSQTLVADGFSLGALDLNSAVIQDAAGNALVSGALTGRVNAIDVAADNRLSFDGTLTGASSFTKTGAGELVLRSANSQTGDIRVNAGTLTITSDAQLGASTARVLIADGATLKIASSLALAATRTLEITGSGAIEVARDATVTYGGVLAGANASSGLVKTGDGTLVLSGANTYSGATDIRSGTLAVSGSLNDVSSVRVARGGVYQLNVSDRIGGLEGAGDVRSGAASGTVNLAVGSAIAAGVNQVFSGVIADGTTSKLSLTKQGAGSLTLSNANSYSGATVIDGGTLSLSTPTLATAGAVVTATNGYASPSFAIAAGATLNLDVGANTHRNFNENNSAVLFTGSGTLSKTGQGMVYWPLLAGITPMSASLWP